MKRTRGSRGRKDVPGQLRIEWSGASKPPTVCSTSPLPASDAAPLVLHLKWDFRTTFPQPTQEALDAGIIPDEGTLPENIRAIHDEHARELLAVLRDLDIVLDARRRGVDPRNQRSPTQPQAQERLAQFFKTEPIRLQRWWENLMDVYAEVFGAEAADAFDKALHAWHADIPVVPERRGAALAPSPSVLSPTTAKPEAERRPHVRQRRISMRLPVPKPLPSAVAARHFGQEEDGKPVRPGAHEVRVITKQQAEKLIDLLDAVATAPANGKTALLESFQNGLASYAEDFGQPAARQLEAYVRRQAGLDSGIRRSR